jgi:hypothetical protein
MMHGDLRPWIIDFKSKSLSENIKALGNKDTETLNELTQQVSILVSHHPDLQTWVNKKHPSGNVQFSNLYFQSELPSYKNTITKYYTLLIGKETCRVFNEYVSLSVKWTNTISINYHSATLLRNIKTLAKQVNSELVERNCNQFPDDQSDFIHFSLYLLKLELINLYFSIQEVKKDLLEEVYTLEDFYLLELNESVSSIRKIYPAKENELYNADKKPEIEHNINFGFNGNSEKLKTIITQLTNKVNLLNEAKTSTEDLLLVLTSKELIPGSSEIYLDCETAVFRDIYDQLKLLFSKLTQSAIGKSRVFYSKNGTLITAQNLSSSKIDNSKSKAEIDKIFN